MKTVMALVLKCLPLFAVLFSCSIVSIKVIKPIACQQIFEFLTERGLSAEGIFFPLPQDRSVELTLPRLRLIDGSGNIYFSAEGYAPDTIERLEEAAERHQIVDRLEGLVLLDPQGKEVSLGDLPRAEFYLIEDWATWCEPCPYLMRELEEFLSRQPPGRFWAVKICHDTLSDNPKSTSASSARPLN